MDEPETGDTPQVIFCQESGSCVPKWSQGHLLTYFNEKRTDPVFWEDKELTRGFIDKIHDNKGFCFMANPRSGSANVFTFLDGTDSLSSKENPSWNFLGGSVKNNTFPVSDIVRGFEILNYRERETTISFMEEHDKYYLGNNRKFFLIGGSDSHQKEVVGEAQAWVKVPRDKRTYKNILDALGNGHSVIAQHQGPVVVFDVANSDGEQASICDRIFANGGDTLTLNISWLGNQKKGEKNIRRPIPHRLTVVTPFKNWGDNGRKTYVSSTAKSFEKYILPKGVKTKTYSPLTSTVKISLPVEFDNPNGANRCFGFIRIEVEANGKLCHTNPLFLNRAAGSGESTSTALVFDVSGSMSEETIDERVKIDAAKDAANRILTTIEENRKAGRANGSDTIAVATLSDYSQLELNLTDNLDEARSVVAGLYPQSMTNVGAGIEEGLFALEASRDSGGQKLIILLSDGMDNTSMSNDEIISGPISEAKRAGIRIFTVGFADQSNLDEAFLQTIARETGAAYYPVESAYLLSQVYSDLRLAAVSQSLGSFDGTVGAGEVRQAGNIDVGSGTLELNGKLSYPGSKLDFELKDPSAGIVDSPYPGAHLFTRGVPVYYILNNRKRGSWFVGVKGIKTPRGGSPFRVSLAVRGEPPFFPVDWDEMSGKMVDMDNLETAVAKLKARSFFEMRFPEMKGGSLWFYIGIIFLIIIAGVAFCAYRLSTAHAPIDVIGAGFCPCCSKEIGSARGRCGYCGTQYERHLVEHAWLLGKASPPAKKVSPLEEVSLIFESGPNKVGAYAITSLVVSMGRSQSNDIRIIRIDDQTVSSTHAKISIILGAVILQGLNSISGTYVGGQRISQCKLADGCTMEIGETLFGVNIVS